ncbi:MAG: urea transporter [Opitutaceae bacterium]|nr:urea transporter [Opitutaceae bacterium]
MGASADQVGFQSTIRRRRPPEDRQVGACLYGFNASLASIALAGRCRDNVLAVLSGIVLSVVLTRGFQLTPVPALTAPFVLSTWLVILATEFWYTVRRTEAKPR